MMLKVTFAYFQPKSTWICNSHFIIGAFKLILLNVWFLCHKNLYLYSAAGFTVVYLSFEAHQFMSVFLSFTFLASRTLFWTLRIFLSVLLGVVPFYFLIAHIPPLNLLYVMQDYWKNSVTHSWKVTYWLWICSFSLLLTSLFLFLLWLE